MIFLPYLLFFLLIYFLFMLNINKTSIHVSVNSYSVFLFFTLVCMIFFGLRGFIENDWYAYYPFFSKLPINIVDFSALLFSNNLDYDVGFSLYTYVCKLVCPNYFVYQFLCFFIDFILLYNIFNLFESKNLLLNYIFFFLFSGVIIEVDLLRNSKSILIFCLSLKYIFKEKSFIKYFLCNLLGCLFHISSIFYIFLYFFLKKEHSKKLYIVVVCVSFFIFILRIPILTLLLAKVLDYIPNGQIFEKLLMYIQDEHYSSQLGFSFIFFERLCTSFVFICFFDKLIKNKKNVVLINIHIIYVLICFCCWDFYIIVQRFSLLFICSYWLLYPEIFFLLKKNTNKYLFMLILFLFGSLKFIKDYDTPVWLYNTCFTEKDYAINASIQEKLLNAD